MKVARVSGAVISLVLCAACGPAAQDPSTIGSAGGGEMCTELGPLTDLQAALSTETELAASSPLSRLVDVHEELAHLNVTRDRLRGKVSPEARALTSQLERLDKMLEDWKVKLAAALIRAKSSHAAAEAAFEAAAVCKTVDFRDLSRPPELVGKKGPRDRPRDEADGKLRKANQIIASSKACAPSALLWATVKNASLTSEVALASVASHVFELELDKERSVLREELARSWKQHAQELRSLRLLEAPKREEQDEGMRALVALRAEVIRQLETARYGCLTKMGPSTHVVGSTPELRRATVNVRPKWSGALQRLAGDAEQFGSGFLVRWRSATGAMETRVVTNNHVMRGAFEADIVSGDATADPQGADGAVDPLKKPKTWTAKLISSDPHDDVAILRLDGAAEAVSAFREGLSFRLSPAKEQEPVIAAGFPGVGVRPSFQVSKGIVSNAKFGADVAGQEMVAAYVQHTAAIDPGNSGGPLLDGEGRLLGMNTFKIVGRENVGLAIPTARVQAAMERADEKQVTTVRHAEASCNAVMGALSADAPPFAVMSRFGLRLFEATEDDRANRLSAAYRDGVRGLPTSPTDVARLRAYGATRAKVEQEGGVGPFEVCANVSADTSGASPATNRFRATLKTAAREHEMIFEQESGIVRLIELR